MSLCGNGIDPLDILVLPEFQKHFISQILADNTEPAVLLLCHQVSQIRCQLKIESILLPGCDLTEFYCRLALLQPLMQIEAHLIRIVAVKDHHLIIIAKL